MDYADFIKGTVTLDEVAAHLISNNSGEEMRDEIFKLVRAVHDDTLLQGYRRGMSDVIGCSIDEVMYWTDEDGNYDGIYKGPSTTVS